MGQLLLTLYLEPALWMRITLADFEAGWEYALFKGLVNDFCKYWGENISNTFVGKGRNRLYLKGLDLNDRIYFLTSAESTSK